MADLDCCPMLRNMLATRPKAMQTYDSMEVGEYFITHNGEKAPEELQDIGFQRDIDDIIVIPPQCPYCKSTLLTIGNFDLSEPEIIYGNKQYYLWYCRN